MTARQVISRSTGAAVTTGPVGSLRFVVDKSHRHWHILDLMRYELRRAQDFKRVRRDRKTGFCVGDRYNTKKELKLRARPKKRVFTYECGYDNPKLLSVRQGLSVGYGDVYERFREGQHIDITGVPAGRYYLVHRTNPTRTIREANYSNNAASVLLSIAWPNGESATPSIRTLAECDHAVRCEPG